VLRAIVLRNHRPARLAVISAAALVLGSAASGTAIWNLASASSFSCSAQGSNATIGVTITGISSNGTSDDFSAIQNAIDAAGAAGGGVVALPAGTFTIDHYLALRNNVELTGAGPATVIKAGPDFLSHQAPAGGYPLITTAGAAGTTISDLTADQSGIALNGNVSGRLSAYAVEGLNSSNVVIDNVYVRNPFTYSIAIVGSTDFCVENSNVVASTSSRYNQLDGIHILDSNSGQVINNVVESGDDGLVAHSIGAPVFNVLYANNKVRGGTTDAGLDLAVGNYPIYGITIKGNNFYGSLYGIRTGYYDNRTGSVNNITISGNYIHGLSQGANSPAIDIGGSNGLGPIDNVVITATQLCHTGPVSLQPGPGNSVTGTTSC
jgi:polygalacturonase